MYLHSRETTPKPNRSRHSLLNRNLASKIFLILVLVVAIAFSLSQFVPPAIVPATAAATEFSAERASAHLREAFNQPHPMGSPEHAATELYIINQLKAMGLQPEIQATTSIEAPPDGQNMAWAGNVRNIVARVPGSANTGAILFMAHYDSVPTTPGASDGGSGTATLLESVRALRAGPEIKNDLILLFTDADVNALLGSSAFLKEHPWRNDYPLVFKFEALGTWGPSMLTYVSLNQGWLMQEVLKAVPHPILFLALNDLANFHGALGPDVHNLTLQGAAGLTFGYFFNLQAYHTPLDNPQNLNLGSLQHDGSYALALIRHFGNLSLEYLRSPKASTPNPIAFNLWRDRVIYYPSIWAVPLAGLESILLIAVVILGLRQQQLTVKGMLLGSISFLGFLIAEIGLVSVLWWTIKQSHPNYQVFLQGIYNWEFYLFSFIFLAIALLSLLYLQGWKRLQSQDANLVIGAWIWWWMLMLLTSLTVPSMSYLLTIPLLVNLLMLGCLFLIPRRSNHLWLRVGVLSIGAVLPLLLITPILYFIFLFMLRMELVYTLPIIGIPMLLVGLLLGALLPQFQFWLTKQPENTVSSTNWLFPSMAGLLSILLIVAGLSTSEFSATQPRPNQIAYVLNADTKQAHWVSVGEQLDPWTQKFFPNGATKTTFIASPSYFPDTAFPSWIGPAPVVSLASPEVRVLKDSNTEDVRTLQMRITSPRGASTMRVEVATSGEIIAANLSGKPVGLTNMAANDKGRLRLMFFNVPQDGFDYTLSVKYTKLIKLILSDYTDGLPQIPGMKLSPRPVDTMPAIYDFADPTIVQKSTSL